MTQLNALLDLANAAAEENEVDMSQASTGGARRVLPAGYAMARFIRYIETGKHVREFQGKAKDPALMFRLSFALFGDGYQNEDGSPAIISGFSMPLGNNEKAKAKIAFDRMNYKGTAKAFPQMLGQPFLVNVKVKTSKASGKEYNEIEWKDTLPPFDPVTKQQYPVPEAPAELYQIFLWNRPTKETWDSLFIEGTRDDGKSKNFLQEECLMAVDFEGSPLHHMLAEHGGVPDKPAAESKAPAVPKAEDKPAEAPATPDAPAMPSAPAEVPEPEEKSDAPATPAMPPLPNMG